MKQGLIHIIVGGQFGSEGKGQVAATIAKRRNIKHMVRTGSINAGHTVLHEPSGERVKMQTIPVGWVNPGTQLYLGPGTYIHRGILEEEIAMIQRISGKDIRARLFIDHRCAIQGGEEAAASKNSGRHHTMGATGKGCSEAVISRLRDRGNPENWQFRMFATDAAGYNIVDVPRMLNDVYYRGEDIMMEGTQGAHLDFLTGPWPYTTNRSCNSAAWLAEAGIPSNWRQNVIMVCRTFPIRVAGNSGPLAGEIEWGELGREMHQRLLGLGQESPINLDSLTRYESSSADCLRLDFPGAPSKPFSQYTPLERLQFRKAVSEVPTMAYKRLSPEDRANLQWIEMTTVTKKIRRLARLNLDDLRQSCLWNNPNEVVLTFLNYAFPETALGRSAEGHEIASYIKQISQVTNARVTAVTVGPNPNDQIDLVHI